MPPTVSTHDALEALPAASRSRICGKMKKLADASKPPRLPESSAASRRRSFTPVGWQVAATSDRSGGSTLGFTIRT